MRRFSLVYLLVPAVLIAASALAYYGFIYSSEAGSLERRLIMDTMRELGEEKIVNIESEMIKGNAAVFEAIDLDNLGGIPKVLQSERTAVVSVFVLDEDRQIPPSGFFTGHEEEDAVRTFFERDVLPDLPLDGAPVAGHAYHHKSYNGRPYLFAYTRRIDAGRVYYIVFEVDLNYWVGSVFPQFFDVRSARPRLYQVADESGDVIFGFRFDDIAESDVVELRFPTTFTRWRLRVAQRDAGALAARGEQEAAFDLVLIGLALAVIGGGLIVILIAIRRERRAGLAKSEFISNVSHELKTPLSIINMFSELLSMGRAKSPEQSSEYADIIRREAVRLSRLIDNVLDFAKIERGADVYDFQDDQDIGELVERALEICSHRLDQAKLELELDVADSLPPVSLDPNAITLAVLNLVDNAIKYASDGGRVEASVFEKGDYVVIRVRDFGPGIPESERGHVFERFYRSRDVRLLPIRGSGIGLSLVKHVAQAHRGRAQLSCGQPGGGCAFEIWIPASRKGKKAA